VGRAQATREHDAARQLLNTIPDVVFFAASLPFSPMKGLDLPEGWLGWLSIVALVLLAIFLVIGLWALAKGRRVAGEHVFFASRWTRGNRLFPSQVVISPSSVTLVQPRWIGKQEESIHLAHVASIKINTHVLFSDVLIETSGGQDPVVGHGHTKGDAVEMNQLIEKFQTAYYKSTAQTPAPIVKT
jgi:predicted small integral membrane protein